MQKNNYLSVSELNYYIKNYLERDYFLNDIYVKGEVGNFKRHFSGTLYFSIKDEKAKINVVMFNYYASKNNFDIKDGSLVLIHGKINVFEAAGTYQVTAYEILYDSIGLLYIKYEQLKKKLENEGLFDIKYKKQIPIYPKTIGIITAKSGAAIHDIIRTIKNRWPIVETYLFPCLVQGNDAAKDIVKNLKIADQYNFDLIILGRGGGSIEDLWPFNEEVVARCIFECNTPIISAVGHQSDFTIADFVADLRALTPTDAAIKATPNINDVIEKFDKLKNSIFVNIQHYLNTKRLTLDSLKKKEILINPQKIYIPFRMRLDFLEHNLFKNIDKYQHNLTILFYNNKNLLLNNYQKLLLNKKNQLQKLCAKLDALSPLKNFQRGYGFINKNGNSINTISKIEIDDLVNVVLKDGSFTAKVINKEKKTWKN